VRPIPASSDFVKEKPITLEPVVAPVTLPHPAGYSPIAATVNSKGEAVRLFVMNSLVRPVFAILGDKGYAAPTPAEVATEIVPAIVTQPEYSAVMTVTGHDASYELELNQVRGSCPCIETLPKGEILLVEPRCRRYADGSHDLNARVHDASGAPVREFLLGDGIEDVQVDRSGQIWVSYFDEGVFGNYGWTTPIGAAGLCCFSGGGKKIWDFEPPPGFDQICDCYALNASTDGVWAYYYSEFGIVRIDRDCRVRGWCSERSGARAIAVRDAKALLYGGYGDFRTACQLLELGAVEAAPLGEVSLAFRRELDLAKAIVVGRDMELHVFSGDDWYKFSLESLP
jgi:hypothetical protein